MIPQRIFLRGFLSYRDEQEVKLDGSSLWMMAGPNGSGKSAIFDAITYALFGYHRGGSLNAVELINHDSERLSVEVDFLLDSQLYQARRTLVRRADGKTSATQQIYRFEDPQSNEKEAVLGTSRKTEFNTWVRENIGLTYETFTSSVLLLQGRAEKLINSTASERFEVLAGIVDLDRFRRLHERADSRRKELRGKIDALRHQLDGMELVGEEELTEAAAQIELAQKELERAQAEVERLQELERQAKRLLELQQKQEALNYRWKQSQQLLTEAEEIEKDLARLRELKEVLPPLEAVVKKRAQIREMQKESERLRKEEEQTVDKSRQNEQALQTSRKTLETLRKTLTELELTYQKLTQRLQELSTVMSRVELCEQQREVLKKQEQELSQEKDDPSEALKEARKVVEELSALSQGLTFLNRFHQRREDLIRSIDLEQQSNQQESQLLEKGKQLSDSHKQLSKETESTTQARQKAENEVSAARALRDQSEQELRGFSDLAGVKMCRTCGQPLTRSHFEEEKKRREKELGAAQRHYQVTNAAYKCVLTTEKEKLEQLGVSQESLNQAREEYQSTRAALQQATRDVERLAGECAQAYQELPVTFQERVQTELAGEGPSDGIEVKTWAKTKFPTLQELKSESQKVVHLNEAKERLKQTEERHENWQRLRAQVEATRQHLQSLEATLPGEVDALRQEHVGLKAEDAALKSGMQGNRREEQRVQQELENLGREQSRLQQRLTTLQGERSTKEEQQRLYEESISHVQLALPEAWRAKVDEVDLGLLNEWATERDRLQRNQTETRAEQLKEARVSLESLKQQRKDLEREIEQFPEEARVSPEDAQRDLMQAKEWQQACNNTHQQAQSSKAMLEANKRQREQVQHNLLEQERDHNLYHLLSQLLGRDRLQRHMVRRAESQVVDHANAVLDRLSGGQLYLRLRGSEDGESTTEKALELEAYNRITAQAPINVSFLSGSQRFRVAVSLALGLGQYASRGHRPIESVIIDEGFGCLDRQGRQVMIQELQNLRDQLRCILLVSHQEEFAEAFPDGYTFEIEDGATKVTRFQR